MLRCKQFSVAGSSKTKGILIQPPGSNREDVEHRPTQILLPQHPHSHALGAKKTPIAFATVFHNDLSAHKLNMRQTPVTYQVRPKKQSTTAAPIPLIRERNSLRANPDSSAQKIEIKLAPPVPIVEPSVEPWEIDLFSQILDLLIVEDVESMEIVKKLGKWLHDKRTVDLRKQRRSFESSSPEYMLLQEIVFDIHSGLRNRHSDQPNDGAGFQIPMIIALAAILAIDPKILFDIWCLISQLEIPIPIPRRDMDVIIIDQEESNPQTHCFDDLGTLCIDTDANNSDYFIAQVIKHSLFGATDFENTCNWGYFSRFWESDKTFFNGTMQDGFGISVGLKKSDAEPELPERRYLKQSIISPIDRKLMPFFSSILDESEHSDGCDCSIKGSKCASTDRCACVKRSGGPAYQHDALRDFIETRVVECGDACGCSLLPIRTPIPYGAHIGDYIGTIVGPTGIHIRRSLYNINNSRDMIVVRNEDGHEMYGVDATYSCNYTRFINHSCSPNLRGILIYARSKSKNHTLPRLALFSTTRIEADTELTLDYSDIDFGGPEYFGECKCSIMDGNGCTRIVGKRKSGALFEGAEWWWTSAAGGKKRKANNSSGVSSKKK
ncbi:hypothetical protein HK100_012937 [Physocladia obscura]|uniref:SET domain-containing protein n=1 Tax=Physocladia obscura TaxID=109957 RepID=A0AAD5T0G1_9FUNG|nr:hypothetical protein HK100_012937 [Physocladia obscura]